MRQARIYVQTMPAGILLEQQRGGEYVFRYNDDYDGPPVSLTLPLKGRKKRLTASAWLRYFAHERLELTDKVLDGILNRFRQTVPQWHNTIDASFLPHEQKALYTQLLHKRLKTLDLCE